MKRFLIGLVLVAVASPSLAQESVVPRVSWTGFYIGGNGGYAVANGSAQIAVAGGLWSGHKLAGDGSGISGGLGGGQAGYNWQAGNFVVGIEGDYQWIGQAKTLQSSCGSGCALTEQVSINSFGTARGRIGAAFDRLLIYGTGGGAYITGRHNFAVVSGTGTLPLSDISLGGWGWTAGGGIEFLIIGGWSAKIEYLYLQSITATGQSAVSLPIGGTASESVQVQTHIARAGFNWHF